MQSENGFHLSLQTILKTELQIFYVKHFELNPFQTSVILFGD